MTVVLVHAREEPLDEWDAAVFLAGPTPRSPEVPSWRPEAVALLRAGWSGGRLVVFVPEDPEGGLRGGWDEQVAWEDRELNRADVIAFWVPRNLTTRPATSCAPPVRRRPRPGSCGRSRSRCGSR